MQSKREILAKTVGVEDVTRKHTADLEQSIKDMTAQRTNVNISPKDKAEIKKLMETNNLSEGIRSLLREVKRQRGI